MVTADFVHRPCPSAIWLLSSRPPPAAVTAPTGARRTSCDRRSAARACRSRSHSRRRTRTTTNDARGTLGHWTCTEDSCLGTDAAAVRFSSSHAKEETYDEFNAKYTTFFEQVGDLFELQRGLNNCFAYDLVPSTSVIEAALRASRKVNDYATAVRILEGVKAKVENKGQYEAYINDLKPVIEELGELGQEQQRHGGCWSPQPARPAKTLCCRRCPSRVAFQSRLLTAQVLRPRRSSTTSKLRAGVRQNYHPIYTTNQRA